MRTESSSSSTRSKRRPFESLGGGSLREGAPIAIVPRALQGGVAAALDALSPDALPRLRFVGTLTDLQPHLRRAVAAHVENPRWLARWMVEDVIDKAGLMAELTGAPLIDLRLDVVEDDRCRLFHVDHVRLRLMTTYRGPGTEWIPPHIAAALAPGALPPPDTVRRLARGEVAVLRGGKDATPERPGVLHRSPSILGTGLTRLLLTIDEAGRRLH